MSTKRPKKEVKSDAILFLEKLGGGPLTFGRLLYFFLFVTVFREKKQEKILPILQPREQ